MGSPRSEGKYVAAFFFVWAVGWIGTVGFVLLIILGGITC